MSKLSVVLLAALVASLSANAYLFINGRVTSFYATDQASQNDRDRVALRQLVLNLAAGQSDREAFEAVSPPHPTPMNSVDENGWQQGRGRLKARFEGDTLVDVCWGASTLPGPCSFDALEARP
jgi:hypothetical protein